MEKSVANELMMEFMYLAKGMRTYKNPAFKLKPWEMMVIMHLNRVGSLRIKEIQKMIGLAPSTVTQIMDGMEEKDLIQRVVNPEDRRGFNVVLAAEGKRLVEMIRVESTRSFQRITDEIGEEDTRQLLELLRRVNRILGNAEDEETCPYTKETDL